MGWTNTVGSALCLAGLVTLLPAAGAAQTAVEIVDRVDRMLRRESSHARVTMDIVTEHWDRSLEMEIWSLGTDHSLVRLLAPPKEEGTATLMVGPEVWNYLPRVDRTIKVPPSLMMGSWMGSHFTNDDLVKESRLIEDYDIDIVFDGTRDGVGGLGAATDVPSPKLRWSGDRSRGSCGSPIWCPSGLGTTTKTVSSSRTMRFEEPVDFGGQVRSDADGRRPGGQARGDDQSFGTTNWTSTCRDRSRTSSVFATSAAGDRPCPIGRLWWRLAWRNLWRNRRRTLITASALAFGFFVSVFMIGVADGIVQAMVQDGTRIITGQVQLHDPDYLPERSMHNGRSAGPRESTYRSILSRAPRSGWGDRRGTPGLWRADSSVRERRRWPPA